MARRFEGLPSRGCKGTPEIVLALSDGSVDVMPVSFFTVGPFRIFLKRPCEAKSRRWEWRGRAFGGQSAWGFELCSEDPEELDTLSWVVGLA
jgi:hypothetical protein